MEKRLFAIKDSIDTSDDDVVELMPTHHEENKLRSLQEDLRDFKSASKKLQSDEDVTLLDVRDIFDALIEHPPVVAEYLSTDASIVKSPDFEDACVKVLVGKETELSADQHELLKPFAVQFRWDAARAMSAVYGGVKFTPPTSNAVERLFSKACHVLSLHRPGILPIRLEMLLFLKVNRHFWGAATVSKVANA
ncbi:hypothetical protein BBJ28_00003742 [Nothophytophthora sp. Chile5]|nr:hypothetical protein BBJ28_00003742 [Nothophytophthora sp. Chile5]